MKAKELRKKSDQELQKLLQDKKAKLVDFKITVASGNVKNVREVRGVKRDIARILTTLNENSKKETNNDGE